MSKLSPTMEEGQLAKWLKKEGDTVSSGEALAEIETDKAAMELQSFASGVLRKILINEGESAPLGEVIAIIADADEDISALLEQAASGKAQEGNKQAISESVESGGYGAQQELAKIIADGDRTQATIKGEPLKGDVGGQPSAPSAGQMQPAPAAAKSAAPPTNQPAPPAAAPPPQSNGGSAPANVQQQASAGGRKLVSPLAARMAAEAGLDLQRVSGSGPGGRIIKRDIEAAMNAATAPQPAAAAPPDTQAAPPPPPPSPPVLRAVASPAPEPPPQPSVSSSINNAAAYRDAPISEMRRVIARRLSTSIGPVPHFFLTTEIEMDRAVELRKSINSIDSENKISLNDLIIKVAAVALMQHPQVNASFQDSVIRYYDQADIGVAVAIEDGLITPIIRQANRKSVSEISREVREMAERARVKRLKPEEYTGATFSISNLGMLGIDEFTAIINPPEAAILAVGASTAQPVVRDNEVTIRQMMRVTMSCDHRIIDGATGARFLQTFKKLLENPLLLL